jgi:uncharacterized membrane protein YeiH
MNELIPSTIFYILESIGILSFALSGMIAARKMDFDPVGIFVLSCVMAFGGGTLRDVILDVQPVYWISHPEYPTTIFIVVVIIKLFKRLTIKSEWLFFTDSLGIALFSITSAQTAVSLGYPVVIVGMLSALSVCSGGVICDIMCKNVPRIFKKETSLYASAAFIGGVFYFSLHTFFNIDPALNMLVSSMATLTLRLLAMGFKWRLDYT